MPIRLLADFFFSRNFAGPKNKLWYFKRAERKNHTTKDTLPTEVEFSDKQKLRVHHHWTSLTRNIKVCSLSKKERTINSKKENKWRKNGNYIVKSFPFCCFPLFLCIDLWGRLSYLSLLFFAFRCLYLSFSLPLFSQLFVRPPQTAILLFCISFPWWWSWYLSPVQCHEPPSIVHQALY